MWLDSIKFFRRGAVTIKEAKSKKERRMNFKLNIPPKNKVIITEDKVEAYKYKKQGYSQKIKHGKFVLWKKLKKWEFLQDRIGYLLKDLKFNDVEMGQSCLFGGRQIDVAGGYEGTFLIFECKSSDTPKFKNLRDAITDLEGKKLKIMEGVRERFGTKYDEVKFILALEDAEINEENAKLARDNDIFVWGEDYLKTAESLFSIIGQLVVHYILKELGASAKYITDADTISQYRVPAFRITVGKQQIYNFFIPAEKLLNLVYVFRLQPGNEGAYQRFISEKRIFGSKKEQGITDFIDCGGFFKTNVVCSFDLPVKFDPKSAGGILLNSSNIEFGILDIPKIYASVWVVDGQHRIYGYAGVKSELKQMNIGVVAYQDVNKTQQARDFIDINQKQKPVDPNYLWNLLYLTDPDSLQGAITKVVTELNKRSSIFKGKIFIPEKSRGSKSRYPLKLANLCNTLHDRNMLDCNGRDNLYKRTSDVNDIKQYPDSIIDYPLSVLDQYFSLLGEVAEKFPDWKKHFILQNNGFNVFIRVLSEVLKHQNGNWNKQETKALTETPLQSYFEQNFTKIKELRERTSNEAGRARIALEVIKAINSCENSFARDFIEDSEKRDRIAFEKTEPYQILKSLETKLRLFIEENLKKINPNWWKERVPEDIRSNANQRQELAESPCPWIKKEEKSPVIFYIDFTDCVKIIERNDNWNEVFQKTFKDKGFISQRLKELKPIRDSIAHSRPISSQEFNLLTMYAKSILEVIEHTKD